MSPMSPRCRRRQHRWPCGADCTSWKPCLQRLRGSSRSCGWRRSPIEGRGADGVTRGQHPAAYMERCRHAQLNALRMLVRVLGIGPAPLLEDTDVALRSPIAGVNWQRGHPRQTWVLQKQALDRRETHGGKQGPNISGRHACEGSDLRSADITRTPWIWKGGVIQQ
jgi:hypothetical protein